MTEGVGVVGEEEGTRMHRDVNDHFDIRRPEKGQQGVPPLDRKDVGSVTKVDFEYLIVNSNKQGNFHF